jgi:hypothetical protein
MGAVAARLAGGMARRTTFKDSQYIVSVEFVIIVKDLVTRAQNRKNSAGVKDVGSIVLGVQIIVNGEGDSVAGGYIFVQGRDAGAFSRGSSDEDVAKREHDDGLC